jgi:hypothetical protein
VRFFVDASIVIYSAVSCPYQEACLRILRAIAGGTAEGYTSTAAPLEPTLVPRMAVAGLTRVDPLDQQAVATLLGR